MYRKTQRRKTIKTSPTLQVTRVSDDEVPKIEVIASFRDNEDCSIVSNFLSYKLDKRIESCLKIKLNGSTHEGTNGENRQVLLAKLADLCCSGKEEEVKKFTALTFSLKYRSDNKFDSNAIEVLLNLSESPRDQWSVGWIPKNYNKQLLDYFSNFDAKYYKNIEKVTCYFGNIRQPNLYNSAPGFPGKDYKYMELIIPIKYKYYSMFPRPSRLDLISL
jgi:hypothetical protein